jgi:3-hydroxyisobutyrate dehydrogenase
MAKVGFIGLGVMGYPMAGHLKQAGHDVTVYNRTVAKADAWVAEYGGSQADTPREAAAGASIVFTIVGADDDVRAVVLGEDGALAGCDPGAVIVDHTTASAELARVLQAVCNADGVGFVDAPVSGGESGAQNGKLTVMCGGEQAHFDVISGIVDVYAVAVTLIGGPGAGQLTKMVNQICIAGLLQGLAEGMNFGARAGLDMGIVTDVIGKGAAGSWQLSNRGDTMVAGEYDFGFAIDLMRKDLGIALGEADNIGASLPVAAMVDQLYCQLQSRGMNRADSSSLMDLLVNP